MKETQMRQFARIRRVQRFALDYLAGERRFDGVRARLDSSVERIEALQAEQRAAKLMLPLDAHEIQPLRTALRERHMIPIGRAGRRLMEFAPGAERALSVPKKRASVATLLTAAERVAKYVRRHTRLFVGDGFPKDFVALLGAAARALKERTTNTGAGRRRHAAATAGLKRELPLGHKDIMIVEALLADRLRDDPAFAERWRHASRMEKRRGRPPRTRRRKRPPGGQDGPERLSD
jgi:hypothetical protein